MNNILVGVAWKFGDNIRADAAINYSPEVSTISDPKLLAKLCMVGYDSDFPTKINKGDFIVAGSNFACGHMHSQFYHSILGAGISAVIADSTGRRFFRDAINAGLPVLVHDGISRKIQSGDELKIDLKSGVIVNLTTKENITTNRLSEFLLNLLESGDIVSYLKKRYSRGSMAE